MNKFGFKGLVGAASLLFASYALAYTHSGQVTIKQSEDVALSPNTGSLVVGNSSGRQVAIDDNEVVARSSNGAASTLYLQNDGGDIDMTGASQVAFGSEVALGMDTEITVDGLPAIGFTTNLGGDLLITRIKSDMLQVYGVILMDSTLQTTGGIDITGTIKSDGAIDLRNYPSVGSGTPVCFGGGGRIGACSSSAEFKTDAEPLAGALSQVMRMEPVSFRWKEGNVPDVGFIAEQAETIIPELAVKDQQGTTRGFHYQHYTAVLTRAVQEQQATIETLEARLGSVTKELSELSRQVAELRKVSEPARLQ